MCISLSLSLSLCIYIYIERERGGYPTRPVTWPPLPPQRIEANTEFAFEQCALCSNKAQLGSNNNKKNNNKDNTNNDSNNNHHHTINTDSNNFNDNNSKDFADVSSHSIVQNDSYALCEIVDY